MVLPGLQIPRYASSCLSHGLSFIHGNVYLLLDISRHSHALLGSRKTQEFSLLEYGAVGSPTFTFI